LLKKVRYPDKIHLLGIIVGSYKPSAIEKYTKNKVHLPY